MSLQSLAHALGWNLVFWSALAGYSLACAGAGLLTMRLLGGASGGEQHQPRSANLAVACLLGLGLLGQLWLLLALGSLFIGPVVYPIVILLIAAALLFIWPQRHAIIRDLRERRIALRRQRLGMRVLLIVACAWLVFTFTALGRPFSGDSLALHMMIPKMVAASGTIAKDWFQPGNEYFGVLGEMTYAVLMQFGNDDAAQMSSWLVLFAIAAVLLGICAKVGIGVRGRIIAMAAFVSSTCVLIWIGEGKIDLIASALGFAALYLLVPRPDLAPLPRSNLMAAGLLTGFAVTAKLMLGFCLTVIAAILLFWTYAPASVRLWRRWTGFRVKSVLPIISAGLIFGGFAILAFAPQFIKNYVLLDAPFAPLGTSGTTWLVTERWYDKDTVAHIRLLYPLVLTFGDYFAQYGQLSVLVLAFLPLVVFLPRPASFWFSPLTAITVAAWVAIAGWAIFQGDKVVMRYILPALLLCIPLAAAAGDHVTARWFRPRILGKAVIAAVFVTIGITASFSVGLYFFPGRAVKVAVGAAQPCDRGLQWCAPMAMVNRAAPQGARVFSASSFKYDLRPDLIQCSYDHRTVPFPGSTEDERWRWFYSQGYSFILPDTPNNPGNLLHDLKNPPPWVNVMRYRPDDPMGPIHISYDHTKSGPGVPPEVTCHRTARGAWLIKRTAQ